VAVRHADQVNAAVQAAVEGKVGRSGIHRGGVLIADLNDQLILALVAQIGHIGAEDGEAALMGGCHLTVDLDRSRQRSCQHFHIGAAACQGLLRLCEGAGIHAGGPQIGTIAVHAVHCIPGVGQGDLLCRALPLGEAQGPVLVQGNDLSHRCTSPF